jgi:hypothetical protein
MPTNEVRTRATVFRKRDDGIIHRWPGAGGQSTKLRDRIGRAAFVCACAEQYLALPACQHARCGRSLLCNVREAVERTGVEGDREYDQEGGQSDMNALDQQDTCPRPSAAALGALV